MGKKIKKKKQKRNIGPKGEDFAKKIAVIHEERMKDLEIFFKAAVLSIYDIFRLYSVQDIVTSLFVSNLWLPNIASGIKHQFLLSIFSGRHVSAIY
ncbi:MAG: hypothetical protein HY787_12995 [Deltaproteobacteria bacterium]|nr:hypothetical protein [Deltaproteobacteria bacterium]